MKPRVTMLEHVPLIAALFGVMAFAASLTPSLIPRGAVVQGALSGVSLAVGYGMGALMLAAWRFLELREWRPGIGARAVMLAGLAGVCIWVLWRASDWQDGVRLLVGLEAVKAGRPLLVATVAIGVFGVLLVLGRALRWLVNTLSARLGGVVPRRVAAILGTAVSLSLVWTLANGVLVRGALGFADNLYREFDLLFEDGIEPPADPLKTGSAASAVAWESLGRTGRAMIAAGPTRAEIEAFTGRPAKEPIRVYVGMNSADDAAAQADLALAELQRTGAFERKVLVIATPTGTGWIDPESQVPLEYLHHGDVATVSVQYSYLASWLALLTDYDRGDEVARVVFDRIYGHWTTLPKEQRPRLYLHGLSLGSYYSDAAADLFKVIGDPFQGAFWVGPPFSSRTWRQVTARREPGSPAWLPRFRDGSLIRFTSQENHLDDGHAPWGSMRIVYLQYAGDPVTFFDRDAWFRAPEWMVGPRGPDVSPDFRWFPVVTQLQLGLDIMMATVTPLGFGHVYAAAHYTDGWVAVTNPEGWAPDEIERLKAHLAAQ